MAKKSVEAASPQGQAGGNGSPPATEKISKREAVERAMAAGVTMPVKGVAYIKEKFGLDLTPQHFSNFKTYMKNHQGKKPRHKAKPAAEAGPVPAKPQAKTTGSPLEAARQVKELVDSYGPDVVLGLVDLFAK